MIEELKNQKGTIEKALKLAHETNDEINSFVTIIDNPKISEIQDLPLANIPYAAKDLFSTAGILTTGSSNILKDYVPFYDATVIKRLKEAGAVLIGKTVCDEFGLGGTGTTGHTGVVRNPWNPEFVAGGSSSGSATSVALGIVPFALGTDTGDSVRKPASLCGVVGYKPTYGLISRYGVLPFASSLDHVGVFTRSVKDAATVVDIIKSPDGKDMTALKEIENLAPQLDKKVTGKKLFYVKELCKLSSYENPDESMVNTLNTFNKSLELAKSLGMSVEAVSIDKNILEALGPAYTIISCAEATSNLSMYTGINYGPRGESTNIYEMMKDARTKGFSPLIKRRLVIGSYVLQEENQERYFLNAQRVRTLINEEMHKLFTKYDAMIAPASTEATPISKASDVISDSSANVSTLLLTGNFGGFPSITIPNGFSTGLPIGLNITGNIQKDADVLNIAAALEEKLGYIGMIAGGKHE